MALGQLGTPYQWGGTCTNSHGSDPRDRCDCSFLMQRSYGIAGIKITRTTYTQIHDGRAASERTLRPGDLVFTNDTASRPEHVAMFISDGHVIHAPQAWAGRRSSRTSDPRSDPGGPPYCALRRVSGSAEMRCQGWCDHCQSGHIALVFENVVSGAMMSIHHGARSTRG
ncbi:NlpC/P60 family protein [Streptomyces sp. NPDC002215]|uniref:C40 family peptidase n=1 Tax=Streptomyces sp. NPDC002215 TaxID=3154412 RepID=UPI00333439F8